MALILLILLHILVKAREGLTESYGCGILQGRRQLKNGKGPTMNTTVAFVISIFGYVVLSFASCFLVQWKKGWGLESRYGQMGVRENLIIGLVLSILGCAVGGLRFPTTFFAVFSLAFVIFLIIGILEEFEGSRKGSCDEENGQ